MSDHRPCAGRVHPVLSTSSSLRPWETTGLSDRSARALLCSPCPRGISGGSIEWHEDSGCSFALPHQEAGNAVLAEPGFRRGSLRCRRPGVLGHRRGSKRERRHSLLLGRPAHGKCLSHKKQGEDRPRTRGTQHRRKAFRWLPREGAGPKARAARHGDECGHPTACGANGICCSWPAPGPGTACTCPTRARPARSLRSSLPGNA